jgi:hypothetical protein
VLEKDTKFLQEAMAMRWLYLLYILLGAIVFKSIETNLNVEQRKHEHDCQTICPRDGG